MSVIAVEDFNDRPYKVPNQKESVEFKDFIEKAEEDLLINLLGYSLYKEFIAGLATGPVLQKWTDLKDGAEYTYSEKLYKYNGLIDFLKPAIYSLWMSVARAATASSFVWKSLETARSPRGRIS